MSEDSQNKPGGGVDLGLGDLLRQSEPDASSSLEPLPDAPVPEEPAPTEASRNPYRDFARSASWPELARYAEERHGLAGPSGLEARLWWVEAQSRLAVMPASILAAPLDAAIFEVARQGDGGGFGALKPLAAQVAGTVGEKLDVAGDAPQALHLYHQIWQLTGEKHPRFAGTLRRELAGLEAHPGLSREPELQARLAELKALASEVGVSDGGVVVPEPPVKAMRAEPAPLSPEARGEALPRPERRSRLASSLAVVSGAAVLGAIYLWIERQPSAVSESSVATAMLVPLPEQPPALLVAPVEPIKTLSQLDAVYHELEQSSSAPSRTDQLPPPAAKVDVIPAREQQALGERERLDLRGPLEPSDVRRIRERALRGELETEREPERIPLFPDPKPTRGASDRYTRLDEPVPGPTGSRFSVLVRTDVFSRPTSQSVVLSELRSGDQVEVIGREGPWARIRSVHGEIGYVFRQDIEPSDERRGR